MSREYRTDDVVVLWDAERCIHAGECVRGAPEVFQRDARPWIDLTNAHVGTLADVVARCPTGALHVERLDGGAPEQAEPTPTVQTVPNGPLYVRGDVEVRDANGDLIRSDIRIALCRCGASENKPFCDNSHLRTGFQAD